jgi:hypothetical protein
VSEERIQVSWESRGEYVLLEKQPRDPGKPQEYNRWWPWDFIAFLVVWLGLIGIACVVVA